MQLHLTVRFISSRSRRSVPLQKNNVLKVDVETKYLMCLRLMELHNRLHDMLYAGASTPQPEVTAGIVPPAAAASAASPGFEVIEETIILDGYQNEYQNDNDDFGDEGNFCHKHEQM